MKLIKYKHVIQNIKLKRLNRNGIIVVIYDVRAACFVASNFYVLILI